MSVTLMSAVFHAEFKPVDVEGKQVSQPVQKLLMLALADHANDDGVGIYPSLTRLEDFTGLSRSTVVLGIKALVGSGLLAKEPEAHPTYGTTQYSMLTETLYLLVRPAHYRAKNTAKVVRPATEPSATSAPYPSLNHHTDEVEKIKNSPAYKALAQAAQATGMKWAGELEPALLAGQITWAFEGTEPDGRSSRMRISGMGAKAAIFQERYGRTLERALVGVTSGPVTVTFAE